MPTPAGGVLLSPTRRRRRRSRSSSSSSSTTSLTDARNLCPPAVARIASHVHLADAGAKSATAQPEPEPARGDVAMPIPATDEGTEEQRMPLTAALALCSSPFPAHRFCPHSSSALLRPGSRFRGSQTSDHQQYQVEVEIKHVDLRDSFVCGYLRIKGLTHEHPSLTTYFEAEVIGPKYTFITQHPEWGSSEKVDRQHWARFSAYRPLSKCAASRLDVATKDWAQKEHLFMRWKEYFLVPDHRVHTINGASFEGFYYICFNQVSGRIEGVYFHAKSEKFQKLQLDHVEDYGCQGAIEFR